MSPRYFATDNRRVVYRITEESAWYANVTTGAWVEDSQVLARVAGDGGQASIGEIPRVEVMAILKGFGIKPDLIDDGRADSSPQC